MELKRLPWQIGQPMIHTQKGVKLLLDFYLSRLFDNTQSRISILPILAKGSGQKSWLTPN